MTLSELLAAAKANAKAILDKADAEANGVLTAEQSAKVDELVKEIESLSKQIEQRAALEAANGKLEQSAGRVTSPAKPVASIQVREAVEDDPMRGFSDIADFGRAVYAASIPSGDTDNRLRVLAAPTSPHRETGSSDGYMVPPAMSQEIYEVAFGRDELLYSLIDSEPTNSNSVELLRDESTAYGATGVKAYWTGETARGTASNLVTESSTVKLHKLMALVEASDELLEDAPRLNNRLTVNSGRAINWSLNNAIMNGTGVGAPLGYRKSGALVTVAKESGQAADTIVAANLAKMYSRCLNPQRGVWLANIDIFPQLVGMTIGDQPVFTLPQGGITAAPQGMIFGRPVIFTELAETLGDAGDIQFVDPLGYYMARKENGVKFAQSMHLYFDYDVHAFKWTFRAGGQPKLSAPVTPNKGSATKSHFIELAARA